MKFFQNNWASGIAKPASTPSESAFERKVQQLGLAEHELSTSLVLKIWVAKHRHFRYVPEWLLMEWGMTVEVYDSKH